MDTIYPDGIYLDENKTHKIDLREAASSIGNLHDIYKSHNMHNAFNDVDWIAETDDEILLIEFTHYERREHLHTGDRAEAKHLQITKKFYGSAFYLLACGKHEAMDFIWVVESPFLDSFARKHYRNRIKKLLPFKFQRLPQIKVELIRNFHVYSVSDWNEKFPAFRLEPVQ